MRWDASTDLQSATSHNDTILQNELNHRRVSANEKLIPIVTVLITLSALLGLSRNYGREKDHDDRHEE